MLKLISTLCLLLFALPGFAQVVVAGQTIGKSTWEDRKQLRPSAYTLDENGPTRFQRGPVLRLHGPLARGIDGDAEFYYDEQHILVAAKLLAAQPEDLLRRLAKAGNARRGKDNSYTLKDLHLRIEAADGQRAIRISTSAFDADLAQAEAAPAPGLIGWLAISLWGLAALVGALALSVAWRLRAKIWARREPMADYLVALALAWLPVHYYLVPHTGSPQQLAGVVAGIYLVSFMLVFVWAMQTVRSSDWLPRRPLLELLWIVPATPVLLIPAIVRNAARSAHYFGLLLFYVELLALFNYFVRPSPAVAIVLLPLAGLFGGGIVRLYCVSFSMLERRAPPVLCALAALFIWPLVLAGFLLMLAFSTVRNFIAAFLLLLLPAILLYLAGVFLESEGTKIAGLLLPLLGLVPGVAGLLLAGTVPTGYSGVDFGDTSFNASFDAGGFGFEPTFNPANGLPIFSGMGGVDVMGNPFGVDFTEH